MPPSWTPPDINIMAGESCDHTQTDNKQHLDTELLFTANNVDHFHFGIKAVIFISLV